MPMRRMTACERTFGGVVNETSCSAPTTSKAWRTLGQRGLGRVAVPPVLGRETPADLDAGREMRLERRHDEAHEADERRHARHLDGPRPEAVAREVPLRAACERIALGVAAGAPEGAPSRAGRRSARRTARDPPGATPAAAGAACAGRVWSLLRDAQQRLAAAHGVADRDRELPHDAGARARGSRSPSSWPRRSRAPARPRRRRRRRPRRAGRCPASGSRRARRPAPPAPPRARRSARRRRSAASSSSAGSATLTS